MDTLKHVTATFTLESSFPVTVTKTGSGGGRVLSAPSGIDCGATCGGPFGSGTIVELIAAAAPGSTFAGWTDGCSGPGTCR